VKKETQAFSTATSKVLLSLDKKEKKETKTTSPTKCLGAINRLRRRERRRKWREVAVGTHGDVTADGRELLLGLAGDGEAAELGERLLHPLPPRSGHSLR
jgi:hypothetical protein